MSKTELTGLPDSEIAGLHKPADHVIGLTACDIYAAYSKYKETLSIVDKAQVWEPTGEGRFMIVNTSYMLRKMLEDLGFEPQDILGAMGNQGFKTMDAVKILK